MGALRKAGVWLGLIEDDDDYPDRGYDHRGYDDYDDDEDEVVAPRSRAAERSDAGRSDAGRSDGSRGDSESLRPHSRLAEALRNESLRAESGRLDGARSESHRDSGRSESHRDSGRSDPHRDTDQVREQARPVIRATPRTSPSLVSDSTSYPTRDNLALQPQPQTRERPVPAEPEDRRYQITTLHPTTYHEARTIGEHFRDGVPVIMNLTEMAEADARRLVDFAAGLAFGLRGSMERVTNRVFLLSPANVQVTPEDKRKIAEGGFFST
jgi:cell division inhibitor SepF